MQPMLLSCASAAVCFCGAGGAAGACVISSARAVPASMPVISPRRISARRTIASIRQDYVGHDGVEQTAGAEQSGAAIGVEQRLGAVARHQNGTGQAEN